MIEINEKSKCSGCGACYAICPQNAIIMNEDEEGFLYPYVDTAHCINCGLCEKTCPMSNIDSRRLEGSFKDIPDYFAGQLKDKETLLAVSSGGAYWAFAEKILEEGGLVYGAKQDGVSNIYHKRAANLKEAEDIRRSKYIQSRMYDIYESVRNDLLNDVKVLFSGTPCQIAGLNAYLKRNYSNLITCEVVCHGVASKLVFDNYCKEFEKIHGGRITGIVFRDKSAGWRRNQYKILMDDGRTVYERSTKNLFHLGYLLGLYYRPSCGSCPYASIPRCADITLADYWNYKGRFTDRHGDLGVSLIVANTEKGSRMVRESCKYIDLEMSKKELAFRSCRHLTRHPKMSKERDEFIASVKKNGFHYSARKFFFREKIRYGVEKFIID